MFIWLQFGNIIKMWLVFIFFVSVLVPHILIIWCNCWVLKNERTPCSTTLETFIPTCACMHPCSLRRWGRIKIQRWTPLQPLWKLQFLQAWVVVADGRYFIPVVTHILIKHQEQSAVPASALCTHTHTQTRIIKHTCVFSSRAEYATFSVWMKTKISSQWCVPPHFLLYIMSDILALC